MTDRPILFRPAMVRALLAVAKTQTRRSLYSWREMQFEENSPRLTPAKIDADHLPPSPPATYEGYYTLSGWRNCQRGDRLWVKETTRAEELPSGQDGVRYLADGEFSPIENTRDAAEAWGELHAYRKGRGLPVNSIHMPKWASRLTLPVTRVRIQRLQDITEEDAAAEGIVGIPRSIHAHGLMDGYGVAGSDPAEAFKTRKGAYLALYRSINGGAAADANPWVVALTFGIQFFNIGKAP